MFEEVSRSEPPSEATPKILQLQASGDSDALLPAPPVHAHQQQALAYESRSFGFETSPK